MPGATSLGIPYPIQPEVVNALSWQNMATAIDTLLTSLDTLRDLAVTRPSARITGATTGAVNSATTTTVTNFTTVEWDTGSYANLGVSPSQLTVPPGLYFATASLSASGSVTAQAMARLQIITGATVWGGAMVDTTGLTSLSLSSPTTLIMTTAATTAIQIQVRWQGTGGPPSFTLGTLQVVQVRQLAAL